MLFVIFKILVVQHRFNNTSEALLHFNCNENIFVWKVVQFESSFKKII